jgi:4-hydroxythreonine-4-phosphate dehydrogenase
MENNKIRVAITHGDTNGIGYELIFKTFADTEMLELCTPIIYGSPKVAAYHRKALDIEANFTIINSAEEARDGRVNIIPCFEEEIKVELGMPTQESGTAALKALDRAMTDYREGLYDVLVTAPLDSNNIQGEGFRFPGHHQYIETSLGEGKKALVVLCNERLRIAVATDETLSLKDVPAAITKEIIETKATQFFKTLRSDFNISNPRVAILALNPGQPGKEEKEILQPAVEELFDNGVNAFGPYAADDFFGKGYYTAFDGILAMYHDQGIAPFKAISPESCVKFAAGLPVIATSPDDNAGFDIAGQCVANADSFRSAIYAAIDIFRCRENYETPYANPLPKLYHEKREDGEKVRFNIPKKREGNGDKKEGHGPKTFAPHPTENKEEGKQAQNAAQANTTDNTES